MEHRKQMITVFDCSLYHLQKNVEKEGNLTYVYNNIHVPFDVKRIFQVERLVVLMRILTVINYWSLQVEVLKWCWMMV